MKTLVAAACLLLGGTSHLLAQTVTYKTLTKIPQYTSEEDDEARLVQAADGNFYGSLIWYGNFFQVTPGGGYTNIANEGAGYPVQGADGNFYGPGFRISRTGGITVLHSFNGGTDGYPGLGRVMLASDGMFYGVSTPALSGSGGTIYRFSSSGAFEDIYNLSLDTDGSVGDGTTLIEALDGNLYGTAYYGGNACSSDSIEPEGCGTIFRLTAQGKFEVLHTFTGGADGANPGELVEASDGSLYGSASLGGDSSVNLGEGFGTIFRVSLNGDFAVIHTVEDDDPVPFGPYVAAPNGAMFGLNNPDIAPQQGVSEITTNGNVTYFPFDTGDQYFGGTGPSPLSSGSDGGLYGVGRGGGGPAALGTVYKFTFDPALDSPVQIHLSSTAVAPGTPVTASFTVNNAFSLSMQQCYGFQIVNGTPVPLGKVSGKYDSGTQLYTGSVSFKAGNAGVYNYALTCGGVESGYAQLTVGTQTTTSLSANPDPVTRPASCTLTATVTADSGTPTGSVTFSTEGVTLGSAPLNGSGVATLTASSNGVTPATYPVIATYSGSQQDLPSSSEAVNVTVK